MESNVQHILRVASEKADLPAEILANLPKISLTGFSELEVEHHDGILEYGTQKIVIGVNLGRVTVEGDHLELKQLSSDLIVVRGTLRMVGLDGGTP